MNKELLKELLELTAEERIDLAQDLWDSVSESELPRLSEQQLAELERRWEQHKQNPGRAAPWEDVRARLWARLR